MRQGVAVIIAASSALASFCRTTTTIGGQVSATYYGLGDAMR
jgi:hypothetical protein